MFHRFKNYRHNNLDDVMRTCYCNNRKSLYRAEIYFHDNEKYRMEDSIMRDKLSPSLPLLSSLLFSLFFNDSINSNIPARHFVLGDGFANSCPE